MAGRHPVQQCCKADCFSVSLGRRHTQPAWCCLHPFQTACCQLPAWARSAAVLKRSRLLQGSPLPGSRCTRQGPLCAADSLLPMASKASSMAVLQGGLDVCTKDTASGSGHLQPLFHALLPGHRWQVSCRLCRLHCGGRRRWASLVRLRASCALLPSIQRCQPQTSRKEAPVVCTPCAPSCPALTGSTFLPGQDCQARLRLPPLLLLQCCWHHGCRAGTCILLLSQIAAVTTAPVWIDCCRLCGCRVGTSTLLPSHEAPA